jgi:two-component system LytT family response regulator
MMIRTLLVDDESLALSELEEMLKQHSDIEIVGRCHSGHDALQHIQTLQPQLLFLDINMPDKSGFEILEELEYTPLVVFVTAHDIYAIKAFEVSALDYLLKPVNATRLAEAIEKIKKQIQKERSETTDQDKLPIDKRIFIKSGDACYFIALSEIIMIESIGNYVKLYCGNSAPMLHKSLYYLEKRLPDTHFFRANRQHIINLHLIKNITLSAYNTLQIEMQNGYKVEISQRQSVLFKELMGI